MIVEGINETIYSPFYSPSGMDPSFFVYILLHTIFLSVAIAYFIKRKKIVVARSL